MPTGQLRHSLNALVINWVIYWFPKVSLRLVCLESGLPSEPCHHASTVAWTRWGMEVLIELSFREFSETMLAVWWSLARKGEGHMRTLWDPAIQPPAVPPRNQALQSASSHPSGSQPVSLRRGWRRYIKASWRGPSCSIRMLRGWPTGR